MKKILPFFAAITVVLTACNSATNDEHHQGNAQKISEQTNITHNHLSGDLQELTSSPTTLPNFLKSQPQDIQLTYKLAGQATDVLQWIPCYCGCGESAGHKSNLNCFIAETRKDGSVVWDDHGTRCDVCVEIALTSVQLHKDGKSLKEIRKVIDTKYKEGYAAPTPTDMPA